MLTIEEKHKKINQESWDMSLQSFGYSYVFSRRARKYGRRLYIINLLGIIVPVLLGATASAYGLNSDIVQTLLWVSIPVSIIQLLLSTISIIAKWEDKLAYSYEATTDYDNLWDDFKRLANRPPDKYDDFYVSFEVLNGKYGSRSRQSVKYNVSDREKRIGMRWALREFKRQCSHCNKVPVSMQSADCGICGNYKYLKFNI